MDSEIIIDISLLLKFVLLLFQPTWTFGERQWRRLLSLIGDLVGTTTALAQSLQKRTNCKHKHNNEQHVVELIKEL